MHHSGVLAGIWPCGTIAFITELFGAESISQVYATLYTFLYQNTESLGDLGKNYGHACLNAHVYTLCDL